MYKEIYVENTRWPIVLDQCYFNVNTSDCLEYPSRVNVTNVRFENVHGTSSGKNEVDVVRLVCLPAAVCMNISLSGIDLASPKGGPPVIPCLASIDPTLAGL